MKVESGFIKLYFDTSPFEFNVLYFVFKIWL